MSYRFYIKFVSSIYIFLYIRILQNNWQGQNITKQD
jgi:hypothetical protein